MTEAIEVIDRIAARPAPSDQPEGRHPRAEVRVYVAQYSFERRSDMIASRWPARASNRSAALITVPWRLSSGTVRSTRTERSWRSLLTY